MMGTRLESREPADRAVLALQVHPVPGSVCTTHSSVSGLGFSAQPGSAVLELPHPPRPTSALLAPATAELELMAWVL